MPRTATNAAWVWDIFVLCTLLLLLIQPGVKLFGLVAVRLAKIHPRLSEYWISATILLEILSCFVSREDLFPACGGLGFPLHLLLAGMSKQGACWGGGGMIISHHSIRTRM